MMNPSHQEYMEMKDWARYWTTEINDWKRRPRVIRY
jgi:hypothetical protein